MTKTTQGQQVKTVKIQGQDYVTVAERSRVAHEIGLELDIGYCIVDERWFEMAGRWFITVTIRVNDQPFQGTAEVKFNATKGADKDAPAECAETSAVGRALGFAGIGALDSIASADEVLRAQSPATTPAQPAAATPQQPRRRSTSEQWETSCQWGRLLKQEVKEQTYYDEAEAYNAHLAEAYQEKVRQTATEASATTEATGRKREPAPLGSIQAYLHRQGYATIEDKTHVVLAAGLPWKSAKGALYSLEELDKLTDWVKAHPAPEPAKQATA